MAESLTSRARPSHESRRRGVQVTKPELHRPTRRKLSRARSGPSDERQPARGAVPPAALRGGAE